MNFVKNIFSGINVKKIFLFTLIYINAFAQFNEFNPDYDWFTIKGKHVEVHYHEGAERTAQITLKIAEEVWGPITRLYGFEPGTVHFVIKDIDDYANGATYFFDNKIEIWASALDFDLRGTHNWLRNVITHEFVHMVNLQTAMKFSRRVPAVYLQYLHYQDERRPDVLYGYPNTIISYPYAGINVPSWFAEGTAQYQRPDFRYESWDSHRDMILRSYVLSDNMLTWNEMGVFGKTSLGNESVYNAGFNLVRYIAENYGEDKLQKIFASLKKQTLYTMDAAVEDVLGIDGETLYEQWKNHLKQDYENRIAPVLKNVVEGDTLIKEGFGNFYPTFIDSGKKLIYLSNKGNDYLSQTAVWIYDFETKKEKKILDDITSSINLILGTNKILYAKLNDDNPKWKNIHDLFIYDIDNDKETRLTYGLRANNPRLSHDGKKIVFLFQKDGTTNLGTVNIDGKGFRQITFYSRGEQVFNPIFTPDNSKIAFGFTRRDNRDIAIIDTNGANFRYLIKTDADERNPVFGKDGKFYYASDKTGIFNIYEKDLKSGKETQITNVIGGAFYPDVDAKGNLAYAGYTSTGYKIFYLSQNDRKKILPSQNYIKKSPYLDLPENKRLGDLNDSTVAKFRNYNDFKLPNYKPEKYKGEFTSLTFLPYIRYDDYNTTSSPLQKIKVGTYISSSDYLNRYDILAGLGLNARMERDLFLIFNYRNKIPGLYALGLKPVFTLEVYNTTRVANVDIGFNVDSTSTPSADYYVKTDVSYNLFEFDLALKQRIFNKHNNIELRYTYSSYTAEIGSFIFPQTNILYPTFKDDYLIASNIQLKYNYETKSLYRDADINPIKRKVQLKLNYEFNRYNDKGEYTVEDGMLKPLYGHYYFPRLEFNWWEGFRIFGSHSISFRLRYGTIFGPKVPDFFDFYLGGLVGMKGYPFYSLSGNELAWINLTYRFPLFRNIDARFGPWYLDKIYFSVYGDYGNAWYEGYPDLSKFKKDVGAELRIKLVSFYIFPTSIFFNWAYSFDRFERKTYFFNNPYTVGKEWRFYFGILFDFNVY